MTFFVTGLPRSRTAWLANFLTADGALCRHEGLLLGKQPLFDWLRAGDPRGVSDSTLASAWPEIAAAFPERRLVIVDRPRTEAEASLRAFAARHGLAVDGGRLSRTLDEIERALAPLRGLPEAIVVAFRDLVNVPTLRRIWDHCLPGKPFSEDRASLLAGLNVQQDLRPLLS